MKNKTLTFLIILIIGSCMNIYSQSSDMQKHLGIVLKDTTTVSNDTIKTHIVHNENRGRKIISILEPNPPQFKGNSRFNAYMYKSMYKYVNGKVNTEHPTYKLVEFYFNSCRTNERNVILDIEVYENDEGKKIVRYKNHRDYFKKFPNE